MTTIDLKVSSYATVLFIVLGALTMTTPSAARASTGVAGKGDA